MATVRFSEALRQSILRKADMIFEQRIKEAKEATIEGIADTFHGLLFGANVALMNACPKGYFNALETVHISGISDEHKDYRYEVNFNTSMRFPTFLDEKGMGCVRAQNRFLSLNHTDPRWKELIPKYRAWCKNIEGLEIQQREFVAGVKTVIYAYSTLAPALKGWPPLWDLIPSETQARHKEITTRGKRAAFDESKVDLNSLSSVVVAHKITR